MIKRFARAVTGFFLVALFLLLCVAAYLVFNVVTYQQHDDVARIELKSRYLARLNQEPLPSAAPNIIFILYDDLGYGDLFGETSSPINTRHIDALAGNGVVLEQFYSPAPVCTPSRAGYLTGRLPARAGLPHVVFPTNSPIDLVMKVTQNNHLRLPAEEILLPEILRAVGYDTAMVGKWHMGDRSPSLPGNFGFDYFFGSLYSNDMTPFALYRNRDVAIEAPVDQTRLSEYYHNEVVRFVEQQRQAPFFLYFAHNFPHIPLHVREQRLGRSKAGLYGDVIEELDEGIGQLMQALEATGQLENTLIILTSDNGPWWQGSPGNLRGRKGNTFEGGMRVPFVAHWPATLPAGVKSGEIAMGMDVLPTVLDWLDIPLPTDRIIDGKSLVAVLQDQVASPHEHLYYFYGEELFAVRDARYKYQPRRFVAYPSPNMRIGIMEKQGPWLFDFAIEQMESYDVTARSPGVARELEAIYEAKRQEMKDNMRGWLNSPP